MANTTNLNLVKPAGTDYALVSVINGNMDIIDSKVGAIPANESAQSQITALNNQMAKQRITPTAGTNVTIVSHNCYTTGNVACVNVSFTMTADGGSTEVLLTGLPAPAAEVPVIAVRNLVSGGSQAIITLSGSLKNSWDSFANGKTYYINCAYAIA